MKILEVYQELTANHVKWLANVISTIEQRYESEENTTSDVANFYKHTSKDIWWFYYDDISSNMGNIGSNVMGFFLGNYAPTGEPVINTNVLKVKDVNLVEEG